MGDTTCPILLCYGDSLTHGNCSASSTIEIPLQLSQKLGLPLSKHPHQTFANPLWVSQCGTEIHQFSYSIGGTIGVAHGPTKDVGKIHSVHQATTSGTDITEI
jgi:hypothetical protein